MAALENGGQENGDPEIGTIACALFDFEGTREDMLPFQQGDVITIIEMNSNGWWKGSNIRGKVGIFPYSYVEVKITSQETFPYARALYALAPSEDDPEMLSFEENEVITILKTINEDWSYGKRYNGDEGRFPMKFVELTGDFNEELFQKETEKWERIENERQEAMRKLREEREELENKLREEEQARKAKEMQDALLKAKEEADNLKKLNEDRQAQLEAARKEIERIKREKAQLLEIRKRAENAEKELQHARAEAALLRRLQEHKDARKSVVVKEKLDIERELMKLKMMQVTNDFNQDAPGPPPMIRGESITEEILEIDEDPFADFEETNRIKKAKSKKNNPVMMPVYSANNDSGNDEPRLDLTKVSRLVEVKIDEEEETKPKKAPTPKPTPIVPPKVNKTKNKVAKRFANLGKGPPCKKCGKSVGIANRVKACKGIYHDTCFRCSTCDKIIRNGDYVDRHDNPYCTQCHKKGFGPKGFGRGGAVENLSAKPVETKPANLVSTQSWV